MDVEAHIQQLHRDGYTVIEDFCDAATLAAIRRGLAPHMSQHRGRNDFEGFETERVYTLVARGKVFERVTEDPRVLALLDRFLQPGYLLSASQARQRNAIRRRSIAQAYSSTTRSTSTGGT